MADTPVGFLGADDLNNFTNTIIQTDPFAIAGTSLGAWKPDMSTWSPAESLATSFGKSFLGSFMQGYARNNAADQLSSLIGVLPQLNKNPVSVVAPDGMDPEAFATIKANAMVKNFQRQAQAGSVLGDLMKSVVVEGIKNQTVDPAAAVKAFTTGDYSAILSNTTDQSKNPKSPQYQLDQDTKALEKTFYDRITNLPQYKLLSDIDSNIKSLPDLAKQDNKAADIGFISTLARIRDPGSTVREGEIAINKDTQSYLDSIYGDWRAVVEGKSRITPLAKLQMIASVVPKFDELATSYNSARNPLLEALKTQGGNPMRIPTTDFASFDLPPVAKAMAAQDDALLRATVPDAAARAQILRERYGGYLK